MAHKYVDERVIGSTEAGEKFNARDIKAIMNLSEENKKLKEEVDKLRKELEEAKAEARTVNRLLGVLDAEDKIKIDKLRKELKELKNEIKAIKLADALIINAFEEVNDEKDEILRNYEKKLKILIDEMLTKAHNGEFQDESFPVENK